MSRKILTILCLALFIVSCSPAPAPNVTVTSQVTVTSTLAPTETPIPTATRIVLNVSPKIQSALEQQKAINPDGTLSTKLLHEKSAQPVSIDAKTIAVTTSTDTSVTEIVTGEDTSGQRYLWNAEIGAWVKDLVLSQEWNNPDSAPFLEQSGFTDGSANLIVAMYYAEHPELISETAIMPHWKLRMNGKNGSLWYILSLYRGNQYLYKDSQETVQSFIKSDAPYGFPGEIRTKDSKNREIVVVTQVRRNPKNGDSNSKQTINMFFGSDRSAYNEYLNLSGSGLDYITGTVIDYWCEMVAVFAPPPNTWNFDPRTFSFLEPIPSPGVAEDYLAQNQIEWFAKYGDIDLLKKVFSDYVAGKGHNDVPETPGSISLIEIPEKLNHTILWMGLDYWASDPQ